jgi:hypothetical protein
MSVAQQAERRMSLASSKSSWLMPAGHQTYTCSSYGRGLLSRMKGSLPYSCLDPGLGAVCPDPVRGNGAADVRDKPVLGGGTCREHEGGNSQRVTAHTQPDSITRIATCAGRPRLSSSSQRHLHMRTSTFGRFIGLRSCCSCVRRSPRRDRRRRPRQVTSALWAADPTAGRQA